MSKRDRAEKARHRRSNENIRRSTEKFAKKILGEKKWTKRS